MFSKSAAFGKSAACTILVALAIVCPQAVAAETYAQPVLQVDVANPTKDKPQSKLWSAHGAWWAWLPVKGGSSIWKRGSEGWQRQTHLDAVLKGLPGQADVWAERDTATAVLVQPDRLAVVSLQWSKASQRYELAGAPAILPMPPLQGKESGIETATISRDGRGRWWVAYNWQREMYVRHSSGKSTGEWSKPITVSAAKANADDLCTIVALPGSVAVVWSDQDHDAIYFRRHDDGASPNTWNSIETAASGGHTADDHLSTVVAEDGTLYIATKNSVDALGKPQLVLRIRDSKGKWTNIPYATWTNAGWPSRPIVQLEKDSNRLLLIHTLYRKDGLEPRRDVIVWQTSDRQPIDLSPTATLLLDSGARLNDATGAKGPLPAGQPGMILASDSDGRVFEAELR